MKKIMFFSLLALVLAANPVSAQDRPAGAMPMFEKNDTNKDGVISKEEYMKSQEEHFAKLDKNGDGSISKDEMNAVKKKWAEKRKERIENRQNNTEGRLVETPAQ